MGHSGMGSVGTSDRPGEPLSRCETGQSDIERRLREARRSDIEHRFTYHPPKDGQPGKYQEIRGKALSLAVLIDVLCPDSREKSLALTKLEEVVMWANAAIARNE